MAIAYSFDKDLSARKVQALFRRLEWSDWWSQKDIDWFLSRTLRVVSAWDRERLIGLGVLTGDGRIDVHLNMLIVDDRYQGQGIGSEIIALLVDEVARLQPYHFQTDVFSEDAERLYARFGFRRNEGTWLLGHEPTYQRWGPRASPSAGRGSDGGKSARRPLHRSWSTCPYSYGHASVSLYYYFCTNEAPLPRRSGWPSSS
jgi:GNAT superfamily N-acetyltransferase